jgi:hypothetical protein
MTLSGISESLRFRLLRQRPQSSSNVLELAGSDSAPSTAGEITTYSITSLRRLCSAISPGGESKRFSSAIIRESRSSILFLTAAISCEWVCQRRVLNGQSRTDFVISVNGDQYGFEGAESKPGFPVDGGGGDPYDPVLRISSHDWKRSTQTRMLPGA